MSYDMYKRAMDDADRKKKVLDDLKSRLESLTKHRIPDLEGWTQIDPSSQQDKLDEEKKLIVRKNEAGEVLKAVQGGQPVDNKAVARLKAEIVDFDRQLLKIRPEIIKLAAECQKRAKDLADYKKEQTAIPAKIAQAQKAYDDAILKAINERPWSPPGEVLW
jgi:hypothetical protein